MESKADKFVELVKMLLCFVRIKVNLILNIFEGFFERQTYHFVLVFQQTKYQRQSLSQPKDIKTDSSSFLLKNKKQFLRNGQPVRFHFVHFVQYQSRGDEVGGKFMWVHPLDNNLVGLNTWGYLGLG